mmetsp:Transcript_69634/g.215280  ORF Transcript_69634/g.215280 Transcript_69634/m.215280 type:complete len:443 (-) Transcript_69634:245-1573(-)
MPQSPLRCTSHRAARHARRDAGMTLPTSASVRKHKPWRTSLCLESSLRPPPSSCGLPASVASQGQTASTTPAAARETALVAPQPLASTKHPTVAGAVAGHGSTAAVSRAREAAPPSHAAAAAGGRARPRGGRRCANSRSSTAGWPVRQKGGMAPPASSSAGLLRSPSGVAPAPSAELSTGVGYEPGPEAAVAAELGGATGVGAGTGSAVRVEAEAVVGAGGRAALVAGARARVGVETQVEVGTEVGAEATSGIDIRSEVGGAVGAEVGNDVAIAADAGMVSCAADSRRTVPSAPRSSPCRGLSSPTSSSGRLTESSEIASKMGSGPAVAAAATAKVEAEGGAGAKVTAAVNAAAGSEVDAGVVAGPTAEVGAKVGAEVGPQVEADAEAVVEGGVVAGAAGPDTPASGRRPHHAAPPRSTSASAPTCSRSSCCHARRSPSRCF